MSHSFLCYYDLFSRDIDECTENADTCSDDASCNNMIGTYSCICVKGFSKKWS